MPKQRKRQSPTPIGTWTATSGRVPTSRVASSDFPVDQVAGSRPAILLHGQSANKGRGLKAIGTPTLRGTRFSRNRWQERAAHAR